MTRAPSQWSPSTTKITLGIPTRTAPSRVWPAGRERIREVPQAQASQAEGPDSQPQLSKKDFGSSRARTIATPATRASWTRVVAAKSRRSNVFCDGGIVRANLY